MAAPIGNQFWKFRSKHGRDPLFTDPVLFWDACCEYFAYCDENPLIETDFRGGKAIEVKIPKPRAYTLQGLCLYLGCNTKYFNDFEKRINSDNEGKLKDFSEVVTRVKETIYTQKFVGAAAGLFNSSIIARDLGLSDKTESKVTVEQPLFGDDDNS